MQQKPRTHPLGDILTHSGWHSGSLWRLPLPCIPADEEKRGEEREQDELKEELKEEPCPLEELLEDSYCISQLQGQDFSLESR